LAETSGGSLGATRPTASIAIRQSVLRGRLVEPRLPDEAGEEDERALVHDPAERSHERPHQSLRE